MMKNKERYDLSHLDFEIRHSEEFARTPQSRITLIYENMPIITFATTEKPFKAILGWLEEDLEDY